MSKIVYNQPEACDIVNQTCAGIDVHRDFVSVTLLLGDSNGKVKKSYREFRTIKEDMLALRSWLLENHCRIVGIESTGKYWYAVYYALEDEIRVNVYNARNMKTLPGKKTDKSDSEWIAMVTRHALLKPSFIPEQLTRDSRVLSRNRKSLLQQRCRVRQIVHGILECAGIKLGGMVSDLFGTSGMNLLKMLLNNEPLDETAIQKRVYGPLCGKAKELKASMQGYIRPAHLFTLKQMLDTEQYLTNTIAVYDSQLKTLLIKTKKQQAIFERIIGIPGFSERSALLLLSEIGFDLSSFPTQGHFCSWAGLAPGSKESAGINKSGKIQVRQRYLRSLLVEVALASTRCKGTFIQAKYYHLKNRIKSSKAIIAIAHNLAKAVYRAIKEGKDYQELTANYVSISQYSLEIKRLSRISKKIGSEAIIAYLTQQEESRQ